jgi:purine-binding chemotaxis protein CheW
MVSQLAVADEADAHAPVAAQWVVFLCHGTRFGVPLDCVREIVAPRPFTRLPGAGPAVCGLAALRGRVITVLDLGVLLGDSPAALHEEHRLLVLDVAGRITGAAVDEVVMIGPAQLDTASATHGSATVGPVARTATPAGAVVGTGHCEEVDFQALDPALLTGHLLQ